MVTPVATRCRAQAAKSSKTCCLVAEPARLVPGVAVFAPAADVRHAEDEAPFEPEQAPRLEPRLVREAVPAVAGQQRGRRPVVEHPATCDQADRDPRPVLGGRERPTHLQPRQIERRRGGERRAPRRGVPVGGDPPRPRLHERLDRVGDAVGPRADDRVDRADGRELDRRERCPVEADGSQPRHAAVHLEDPQPSVGRGEALDRERGLGDDLDRVGDRRVGPERDAEDPAVRRVMAREDEHLVPAEHDVHRAVLDRRDLPPRPLVLLADEDLPLAAVTALDPIHHPAAVGRGRELVLRDPFVGEHPGQVAPVLGRPELVEPHLLEEPEVLRRPLVGRGVPRVPERARVAAPRERSAHQRDPGDAGVDELPRRHVEHVQGAVLGAVRRQRDRDETAVRRWHVPVDRGRAARIDLVRIDDHALGGRVLDVTERDEEPLLLRRLVLQREGRSRRPGRALRRTWWRRR